MRLIRGEPGARGGTDCPLQVEKGQEARGLPRARADLCPALQGSALKVGRPSVWPVSVADLDVGLGRGTEGR